MSPVREASRKVVMLDSHWKKEYRSLTQVSPNWLSLDVNGTASVNSMFGPEHLDVPSPLALRNRSWTKGPGLFSV